MNNNNDKQIKTIKEYNQEALKPMAGLKYNEEARRIWYEKVKTPAEVGWNAKNNGQTQDWTRKMLKIARELNPIIREMNSRFVEAREIVRFYNNYGKLQQEYCSPDKMLEIIEGNIDDEEVKNGVQEAMVNIKNWAAHLNKYYNIDITKDFISVI